MTWLIESKQCPVCKQPHDFCFHNDFLPVNRWRYGFTCPKDGAEGSIETTIQDAKPKPGGPDDVCPPGSVPIRMLAPAS
jgi:hypothetical protein